MTQALAERPITAEPATSVSATTVQRWLDDGGEIAFIDVREHGQYGEGHPFLAVHIPYSRLEVEVAALVPRLATRVVLLDDADGVAERATRRLRSLGYSRVWTLQGGAAAWAATGRTLFQGQNLPSKTFGERVEQAFAVPHISARKLQARIASGQPLVLLDGRTLQEHRRMTIPGAIPVPNGELALRWHSVVPDPRTPVVVHCAGRTRSIVGAQILRDLGVPNPVYALENGTQGWALAGLALERGSPRDLPPLPGDQAQAAAREQAQAFAARSGVAHLDAAQAQAWIDDDRRTTYVFDVRTAAEHEAGTRPGARHAPGGQLLQTTDQLIGVRHARVLVLDGDGIRAPVIAAWLRRLGIEAATVDGGIEAPLRLPVGDPPLPALPALEDPQSLLARRAANRPLPALFDLRPSKAYREGHAQGARWSIRPRLAADVARATGGDLAHPVSLIAEDEDTLRLAAHELTERGHRAVTWLRHEALRHAGWPQQATPQVPSDDESIDYLFFVHDRHDGNLEAARRYLEWETGLIAQCAPEELGIFALPAPG